MSRDVHYWQPPYVHSYLYPKKNITTLTKPQDKQLLIFASRFLWNVSLVPGMRVQVPTHGGTRSQILIQLLKHRGIRSQMLPSSMPIMTSGTFGKSYLGTWTLRCAKHEKRCYVHAHKKGAAPFLRVQCPQLRGNSGL